MNLGNPPRAYDVGDQARMRGELERADDQNLKRGVAVDFILLKKPDGTVGRLTVDNTDALVWTAL